VKGERTSDTGELTTAPVDDVVVDQPVDTSAILTIPNVLSIVRLCMIPVFLYLLFGRDNRAAAAWLLAGLGVTDWVDGYIARHFNQVSDLGKILDPTADRLLLAVGVIAILVDGSVPVVVAVLTIVRECSIAVLALILASLGARRIDVTWLGKAGTFGMLVAYPLFLAGHSTLGWADTADVLAWVCAVPGLIFGYLSAAQYVPLARRALAEGRRQRAAA
jgi:cardiolipin synthase (CMP-forming)